MPSLRSDDRRTRSFGKPAATSTRRPGPSSSEASSVRIAAAPGRKGRSNRRQQDTDDDEEEEEEEVEGDEDRTSLPTRTRLSRSLLRLRTPHTDDEDVAQSAHVRRSVRKGNTVHPGIHQGAQGTLSPLASVGTRSSARKAKPTGPAESISRRLVKAGAERRQPRQSRLSEKRKSRDSSDDDSRQSSLEISSRPSDMALRSDTTLQNSRPSDRQNGGPSAVRRGLATRRRGIISANDEEQDRQVAPGLRRQSTRCRNSAARPYSGVISAHSTRTLQAHRVIDLSSDDEAPEYSPSALRRRASQRFESGKKAVRSCRSVHLEPISTRRVRSQSPVPQRQRSGRAVQRRMRLYIVDTASNEGEDEVENDTIEEDEDQEERDVDDDNEDDSVAERPMARKTRQRGRKILDTVSFATDASSSPEDDMGEEVSSYNSWTGEDIPVAKAMNTEPGFLDRADGVEMLGLTNEERKATTELEDHLEFRSQFGMPTRSSYGRRVTKRRRLGLESPVRNLEVAVQNRTTRNSIRPSIILSDSSGGEGDDAESGAERLIDPTKQSGLQRHWDNCGHCGERPAWMDLTSLKRTQSRLDANRAKELARSRPTIQQLMARRTTGHYDTGLPDELTAFGSAQVQVDEKRRVMEERGAWLLCSTCCGSSHTGCQGEERMRHILHINNAETSARHRALKRPGQPKLRHEFSPADYLTSVKCDRCWSTISPCHICQQERLSEISTPSHADDDGPKLFRCKRCYRIAHYECLQQLTGEDELEEAALARHTAGWRCIDCDVWGDVDIILAWRPQSDTMTEDPAQYRRLHRPSDDLKRDYLVKFKNMSFRETQWVPHHWLSLVSDGQLRYFLAHGTRLELESTSEEGSNLLRTPPLPFSIIDVPPTSSQRPADKLRRSTRQRLRLTASRETGEVLRGPPAPESDAQARIPRAWITPDRILDLYFHKDSIPESEIKAMAKEDLVRLRRRPRLITRFGRGADISAVKDRLDLDPDYVHVSQVDEYFLESITEQSLEDMMSKAQILTKWDDLEYEQSTWENGARASEYGAEWLSLVLAFQRHLASRKVYVKHMSNRQLSTLEAQRKESKFQSIVEQPDYIVGGQMLDFQIDGLNWLRYGWHKHQPGILADEMGLGKTVQIVTFVASLHQQFEGLAPYLIVVPNSVVTNWVREFEKWCPHLRIIPYCGGKASRGIIERFELFHLDSLAGRQDLRADVVICSDSIARLDPAPLRRVQRWQALIVDEGTNLKAGNSTLLYRRLSALNTAHRIIVTGTPLNNNIGELFNLLNWLKPNAEWEDVKGLSKKYAVLTSELIAELQPLLNPYFLRRLKKDVVDLPPRSEVLVPISLTPLQKRVYKDVLEKNIEDIQALTEVRSLSKRDHKFKMGNMMNILMQLRKVCQHPYLIAPSLETFEGDRGHDWKVEAERLVEASSKLKVLQKLLPQLKAKNRRVLIFSQFVIFLDIVESFLLNEGTYKYLRLDGSFGHRQRQRGISAFNAPGSEYFCYLLSTRAGGVGINLAGADTVIILDSDFNPHLDMQAIARAHRIGQTRKVIVFTLMAMSTAEEEIVHNARKKLLLDHVIHTIDDEENRASSLRDALQFGAGALFEKGGLDRSEKDVDLTDQDVSQLIEHAEQGPDVSASANTQSGEAGQDSLLSFARVWERGEQADPTADMAEDGFWTALLAKTRAAEADAAGTTGDVQEDSIIYGRGGKRRAKLMALAGAVPLEGTNPLAAQDLQPHQLLGTDGDMGDDGDWTMDLSVPELTSTSVNGTTSLVEAERTLVEQPVQPVKAKRGRPRKYPRNNPLPAAVSKRAKAPAAAPDTAAAASGVFDSTSRSLPKPPRAPRQPKKSRQKDGASGAGTSRLTATNGTPDQQLGTTESMSLYSKLAEVRDHTEAMALCVAAYPNNPTSINQVYNAWVGVMLGDATRLQGAALPSSSQSDVAHGISGFAHGSASDQPAVQVTGPSGPTAGDSSDVRQRRKRGPRGPYKKKSAPGTSSGSAASGPQASTASQLWPAQPLPREVTARQNPSPPDSGLGRSSRPLPATERPGDGQDQGTAAGRSVPRQAPTPATPRPGIAGFQQPGQPPLAQQPSILEQQPASGFMEISRTTAELKKIFKDLPESFMSDVKLRQAQRAPKPLLIPEHRSQLTKTHMAYFSLRLLSFLGGIHPLFNDAFALVQSQNVPPRIRAQPFEGAEMLSITVVTERLIETAHYYYAQSLSKRKKGHGPRQSSSSNARARASGSQRARPAVKSSTMSVDHVLNEHASLSSNVTARESPRGGQHHTALAQPPQYLLRQVPRDRAEVPSTAADSTLALSEYHQAPEISPRTTSASAGLSISSRGRATGPDAAAGRSTQPPLSIATISTTALPPDNSSESERLAFFWLQAIDALGLAGMSKASRMWLLQPIGPERDVMGQEINERLSEVLSSRRRLGQPIPHFFRQGNSGGGRAMTVSNDSGPHGGQMDIGSSSIAYGDQHKVAQQYHAGHQPPPDSQQQLSHHPQRRFAYQSTSSHNAGWPGSS